MSIKSSIFSVLLVIYALRAGVVSSIPTPNSPNICSHGKPEPIRAGVNITVFNDTSCGQSDVYVTMNHSFYYAIMWPTNFKIQSYTLSRFVSSKEQLDWNNPYASGIVPPGGTIPVECGTFIQTTSPDSNGNVLHQDTCYQITGGAQVCHQS